MRNARYTQRRKKSMRNSRTAFLRDRRGTFPDVKPEWRKMPQWEKKYFVGLCVYLGEIAFGARMACAAQYDLHDAKTGPFECGDRMVPINFETVEEALEEKEDLGETPTYVAYIMRRDMLKERIKENDTKTEDRTMAVLGRILYSETRLPGARCDRCKEEREIYLETILYPFSNSLQSIWGGAP